MTYLTLREFGIRNLRFNRACINLFCVSNGQLVSVGICHSASERGTTATNRLIEAGWLSMLLIPNSRNIFVLLRFFSTSFRIINDGLSLPCLPYIAMPFAVSWCAISRVFTAKYLSSFSLRCNALNVNVLRAERWLVVSVIILHSEYYVERRLKDAAHICHCATPWHSVCYTVNWKMKDVFHVFFVSSCRNACRLPLFGSSAVQVYRCISRPRRSKTASRKLTMNNEKLNRTWVRHKDNVVIILFQIVRG